jgi:hypothetical protein
LLKRGGRANTHSKITAHEKVLFVKQVLLIFSCLSFAKRGASINSSRNELPKFIMRFWSFAFLMNRRRCEGEYNGGL